MNMDMTVGAAPADPGGLPPAVRSSAWLDRMLRLVDARDDVAMQVAPVVKRDHGSDTAIVPVTLYVRVGHGDGDKAVNEASDTMRWLLRRLAEASVTVGSVAYESHAIRGSVLECFVCVEVLT